MDRKRVQVLLLTLLGPSCGYGRLGGGDGPDPALMALLSPPSVYSAVLWPCLATASVLLAVLHRADWREQGRAGARRLLSAGCAAILSAVALFGAYPHVCRNFFVIYGEMSVARSELPACLLPPVLAMGKPVAGLALLVVWFLLQPGSIQFVARHVGRPDMQKLPVWPLALFLVGFTVWLFAALMRPLTGMIG